MYVLARGKIHHSIGATTGCPTHLLYLFRDIRSHGTIPDVGINFHQEIAPNYHRLAFWVIYVRGYDRPTRSNLIPHKFRRNLFWAFSTEPFTTMLPKKRLRSIILAEFFTQLLKTLIFADGDKLHFRGHNPTSRVPQLRNGTIAATQRFGLSDTGML